MKDIANTPLVSIICSTYNHGFVANIINWVSDTKLGINVVTTSLITMIV